MPLMAIEPAPLPIKRLSDEGGACVEVESHARPVLLIRCRAYGDRVALDAWRSRTQSVSAAL